MFLKMDFPRVPLTDDVKLFRRLVALGAELVELHLMRSPALDGFITWLKDRKDRTLSRDDIAHYQRVVVALEQTIRLMKEIDKAIPGWPLE